MSNQLEQRLRDAFEASASQVTLETLDHEREHHMRQLLAPSTRRGPRPMALAVCGGLAAASLLFGTVVLINSDSKPTTDAAGQSLTTPPETMSAESTDPALPSPTTEGTDAKPGTTEEAPPAHSTQAKPSTSESSKNRTARTQAPPVTTDAPTTETEEPTAPESSLTQAGSAKASVSGSAVAQGNTITVSYAISGTARESPEIGTQPTFTQVTYGDGQQGGSDGGGMICDKFGAVAPINGSFGPWTHTYAKAGTYTVTFTVGYCGDSGATTTSTTRTVTVT